MHARARRRRFALAVGTLVLAALVLTSCLNTPVASGPPPIKIGTLLSPTLSVSNWLAGLKAAARGINAHGGINGRRVQIDNCDDRFDPNLALQCAHRLINDGVVAMAGDFTEFGNLEAPIFDQAGIPEVGPFVFSREESSLPTSFPWEGGNTNRLAALIFGVKRRGLHSMYIAVWDVPGEKALLPLATQVAKQAGINIVGQELIPSVATDFSGYVQAAIQSQADAFYAAMPPMPQLQFMTTARQAHARFIVALPAGELAPSEIQQLGGRDAVIENAVEFNMYPPLSAAGQFPALRTFIADMDAEWRSGDRYAAPEERASGVLGEWMSIQIIAKLASRLTTVNAATMLRELNTAQTVDTLGLTAAPWHPNQPVPALFPRTSISTGWFVTMMNGVETLADPTPFNLFQALGSPG